MAIMQAIKYMQPGGKSIGRMRYVVTQSIVQDDKFANGVSFHHEF
jgi:hypothetical protein